MSVHVYKAGRNIISISVINCIKWDMTGIMSFSNLSDYTIFKNDITIFFYFSLKN